MTKGFLCILATYGAVNLLALAAVNMLGYWLSRREKTHG